MFSVSTDFDVASIMDDVDKEVATRTETVSQDLWAMAVKLSPVWSGFYRASWNLSVGSEVYSMMEKRWTMPNAYMKPNPITIAVQAGTYQSVFLTNGADYAGLVEYGGPQNTAYYVAERAVRSIQ